MIIQSLLVILAVACVPCMLIVKPLIMRSQHLRKQNQVRWSNPETSKLTKKHFIIIKNTVTVYLFNLFCYFYPCCVTGSTELWRGHSEKRAHWRSGWNYPAWPAWAADWGRTWGKRDLSSLRSFIYLTAFSPSCSQSWSNGRPAVWWGGWKKDRL